nr:RNA-dependent RNA polymerase [Reoviridae sp.]UCD53707.1 MAG: RNA-dependent RNA polymerase [Reoviridae sp.]
MYNSHEIETEGYEFNTNYQNEICLWIERIDEMAGIPFNQAPLVLKDLIHYDRSLLFGFTNREFILKLLKEVQGNDLIKSEYIQQIRHPPDYVFGTSDFRMNLSNHYIESSPIQYISNINAFRLVKEADMILALTSRESYENIGRYVQNGRHFYKGRLLTGPEFDLLQREAVLMRNFVLKYSSSRRLLPIYKLIQIVVETSNFHDSRGFPWQLNPILTTISELYRHYEDFPYREVDTETIFLQDSSMILPEITFALVELWFKYLLIDMSKEELIVGINSQLEWATTSLDAKLLEFKDLRVNLMKILIDQTIEIVGIVHGYKSLQGIIMETEPKEIWLNDIRENDVDFQKYEREFIQTCPVALREYLTKCQILGSDGHFSRIRVVRSLFELKRLYTVINVICQHGLFIKNPVILTISKSILPRGSIAYASPARELMFNPSIFTAKLPLHLNWDVTPVFREMLYEGRKIIGAYSDRFNKLNLEEEFIKALTNNSGGVDYQPTKDEIVTIPENILRAFGKKRLMYFLLNPIIYSSFVDWINALKSITNSGERKQVDRRGRVIQMVSNAAQLGPFLLFLWLDLMGKLEDELSSKKNTGGITDINALLRASSNMFGIQESADISGMDASTTRVSTSFVNNLLIELLQNCDHDNYFFSRRTKWDIFSKNDNEQFLESRMIHPGVPVLQISEAISENFNYRLNIPELSAFGIKINMDTSPQVFPSGKFSTNAQHSLLNMLVLRTLRNRLMSHSLQHLIPIFNLRVKVSGDDIFAAFDVRSMNDDAYRHFSQNLVKIFTEVGFKIGSLLSRYSATFLQQSAIFGTVLPKPDRISLTTSERGDSLKVGVFDAFSEIRDIIKELSGRVHYPGMTRGLLFHIANQLRRVRINTMTIDKHTIQNLKNLNDQLNTESKKYISNFKMSEDLIPYRMIIGKNYVHLILPLISLFTFRGFEIPMIATAFKSYVPGSNVFTPRGSINDWKIRKLLLNSDRSLTDYKIETSLVELIESEILAFGKVSDTIQFVRTVETKLSMNVKNYLTKLYDYDLARYLGLHWLKHFTSFDVREVLERIRLSKFPKEIRDEWADRLKFRLNFDAIIRSKLAGIKLMSAGFKVSKRLAFYNSPNERITQAITTGGDTSLEFRIHRLELLLHMSTFKPSMDWQYEVPYEAALLCDYEITTIPLALSRDFIIDVYGGLMLSSGIDMDRDIILYKFGHNFYDLSVQFSGYYALTPGPFKDYKHEELVQFAAHVKRVQPTMLPLVWEFANIHERYQKELERIIEYGEVQEINEWKSIIHTRQTFELSTSIRHVRRLWEYQYLNDSRINRMTQVIMRDISYSENGLCLSKGRFQYSQVMLLLHGGMRSKIQSLLSVMRQ